MDTVDAAIDLFRRGRPREAEAICERRLALDPNDLAALSLLAEMRVAGGEPESAAGLLVRIIELRPADAAARRRLAGARLAQGHFDAAIEALDVAIRLEPGNSRAHNNLGKALLALGRRTEAIASFENALRSDPHYAIAHCNLALAHSANGDASRALDCYDRALAQAPGLVEAWVGRGTILATLLRFDLALSSFTKALELSPDDAPTLIQRAATLLSLERALESLNAADAALRINANLPAAHNVRAGALRRLGRRADAVRALRRAVEIAPHDAEYWGNLATLLHEMGDFEQAVTACRRAVESDPTSVQARTRLLARLIPSVPASAAEVAESRRTFDAELATLETWLAGRTQSAGDARSWDDAVSAAQQQFFYLAYDEESNRPLLQRVRGASAARLARLDQPGGAPVSCSTQRPALTPRAARRFKLGFVSAHVHDHSVFNAILKGWLERLDPQRFELELFNLGKRHDACTDVAVANCRHVEIGPRGIADWARAVRERELDALIYPEIGMNETTLALASLRLAEHQFVAWGHPETSGLPTLDGYLSAELFEPPGAEAHYSERLIRLPNLGVYCERYEVEPAPVDLAKLGIERGPPLLLCPGVPFKYRPQHDSILVEIARRLGRCTLQFFEHEIPELSHKLEVRLHAAFARARLDPKQYLKWIPWQPRASFFGLMNQADVYLDTLGFSGFNTLMQAVQCRLPTVTLAGRFMRGRLGSGILERLGLPELIARDTDHYIELAVRLAEDSGYRASIRAALRAAEHRLYRDSSAIDALSDLLLNLGRTAGP